MVTLGIIVGQPESCSFQNLWSSEMTAEYACTRKQFSRNLSEFGLIQVLRVLYGWHIVDFIPCTFRRVLLLSSLVPLVR